MTSESQFIHKDITHITIAETDDNGIAICSGCKEPVVVNKAYKVEQTDTKR